MKNIMFLIATFIFSQNVFAGDAGYSTTTCTSASGRTVLTMMNDYFGENYIYTLIIDGMPAIYKLDVDGVTEVGDDGYVTYYKDGEKAFSMNTPESTITVYQDPRVGSIAMNNAEATPLTIKLSCKDFFPNP